MVNSIAFSQLMTRIDSNNIVLSSSNRRLFLDMENYSFKYKEDITERTNYMILRGDINWKNSEISYIKLKSLQHSKISFNL